jgi:lipid-A-disaccharide synthase
MPLIYLIAGEASGDVLGARLMAALQAYRPDLSFAGVGGERMALQGLTGLFSMQDLALVGFMEVLPRLYRLRQRLGQTVADIKARRPDMVVTIDSPGFTLRLLKAIRALGIRRVHYVAPQVWAWRERRVRHYPGLWDQLLCLLPFEPAFFARHDLAATFVGHPVLESGADRGDGARFRANHGVDSAACVLTLMPGSRPNEVAGLLPILGATLRHLPDVLPVIPVTGPVAAAVLAGTRDWLRRPVVVTDLQDKHDAFAASAAALTKSGTSTLELAMAAVPMVVTYRISPLTAAIARHLFTVPHVSLVNLLAQRAVVPELLQEACTPNRLAEAVRMLLDNPGAAAQQRSACNEVLASLRPSAGTPSAAAADAVLALLD